MPYIAQLASFNHLMSQRDGRAAAIVEPNKRLNARLFGRLGHLASFFQRVGHWLFARTGLARRNRRLGNWSMHEVGRDHIDQANLGRIDDSLPIGGRI